MIKIPALSVLLCLFSLPITAQNSKTTLHKNITNALAKENLAGAVWSTVDSLGNISTGAGGLKNAETKQMMSITDKVQVGSITKTLIATGIFRLVTMNKMSLDTPVEEILSDIRFKNPWSGSHPVTVRHLLDHTAGLENLRLWQMFSEQATPNSPLADNFRKHPSTLQIHSCPGTQFAYSNMGYALLGMVIEAVTRQRYEDYLDTYVLKPIGMSESTFGFVTQIGKNADHRLAMGHLDHLKTQSATPMYLRPAGQFTTTAKDMGIFLKFLMTNGNLRGYSFIRKDLLLAMGNPDGETESKQHGLEAGYAEGLMKRDRHQVIGLAHAGNTVGYHAMIYLFPKEKKAFFISHNMDSETADYEVFNKILLESLNLKPQKAATIGAMPVDIQNWAGNYVAVRDQFKMMAYVDLLAGFVTVIPRNGYLVFSQLQKEDKILKPTRYHLFKSEGKISDSHVFYTDSTQTRRITDGAKTYKKISSLYLWSMYMSLIFGLLGLCYLFVSGWIKLLSNRKRFLQQAIAVPFFCILALLLPIPLFMVQHFTALGDLTAASMTLAVVSAILPIGLIFGLWRHLKRKQQEQFSGLTTIAFICAIQWVAVLGYWGMIPMVLWN